MRIVPSLRLSQTTAYLLTVVDPGKARGRRGPPGRADTIAIGTHGRSGLSRALLGSVAEALIRTSSVPVLVVRDGMRVAAG